MGQKMYVYTQIALRTTTRIEEFCPGHPCVWIKSESVLQRVERGPWK